MAEDRLAQIMAAIWVYGDACTKKAYASAYSSWYHDGDAEDPRVAGAYSHLEELLCDLQLRAERAEAREARLREALEHYAGEGVWNRSLTSRGFSRLHDWYQPNHDGWTVARAALAGAGG